MSQPRLKMQKRGRGLFSSAFEGPAGEQRRSEAALFKVNFRAVMSSAPAFSTPVTVGRDQHLAAVARFRVVHVQLQLVALVLFHDGEQIIALEEERGWNQPLRRLFIRMKYLLSPERVCTSFIKVSVPIM